MRSIFPIALNTFREARRNRIFYSVLFFAVAFILFSVLFTEVTFVAQDRVLRDVGFGAMSFFTVLLAIFLGIGMVNREIEKKTIFNVISKPVPRWSFIVGKGLGLMVTLSATLVLMFLGFLVTLKLYRSPIDWVLLQAVYALLLELSVITAFAVFCSSWTSSALSAFFTGAFFIIGQFAEDIRYFGTRSHSGFIHSGSKVLFALLPDLHRFNLQGPIAYLQPVTGHHLLALTAYALLWAGAYLCAAIILFQRRDFR